MQALWQRPAAPRLAGLGSPAHAIIKELAFTCVGSAAAAGGCSGRMCSLGHCSALESAPLQCLHDHHMLSGCIRRSMVRMVNMSSVSLTMQSMSLRRHSALVQDWTRTKGHAARTPAGATAAHAPLWGAQPCECMTAWQPEDLCLSACHPSLQPTSRPARRWRPIGMRPPAVCTPPASATAHTMCQG